MLFGETYIFLFTWRHTVWKHALFIHAPQWGIFLIVNEADTFPLTLPTFPNFEYFSHFFVCFFLHLLFSEGVSTTVFTKPAVTQDLFVVQTTTRASWKNNELQNRCATSELVVLKYSIWYQMVSNSINILRYP